MKVLLSQDVQNHGKAGEIIEVSDGFARNFLFPKNLAKVATPDVVKEVEERKVKQAKVAEADLMKTEELAQKLDGFELEISAKASEEGTLFAAVTSAKISSLLKEKGFEVGKDQIIADHVKEVGDHELTVNFPHGLEARITLIVTSSKE